MRILLALIGMVLCLGACKKESLATIDPLPQDTTHYPGQYPVKMTISSTSTLTFVGYDINDSSNHNFYNLSSSLTFTKTVIGRKGYKLQLNATSASPISFKYEYYGRTHQDNITSSGVSSSALVCP